MKSSRIQFDRLLLFLALFATVVLGLKYVKQYIYLSFTLLTLKFVWFILILLVFLHMIRKRT